MAIYLGGYMDLRPLPLVLERALIDQIRWHYAIKIRIKYQVAIDVRKVADEVLDRNTRWCGHSLNEERGKLPFDHYRIDTHAVDP